MNRRDVLKRIAGGTVAAAAVAPVISPELPGRYGAVSVDVWRHLSAHDIYLHVYRNGVDVTTDCTFFDDTPGKLVARLLKRHPLTGHRYIDGDEVASEDVTDFEVRRGGPLP